MNDKTFTKEELLASGKWSDTDRILLSRVLKDEERYTREQAAAKLKKIKTKAVG